MKLSWYQGFPAHYNEFLSVNFLRSCNTHPRAMIVPMLELR